MNRSIELTHNEDLPTNRTIFLPSFKHKGQSSFKKPNLMSDVIIKKEDHPEMFYKISYIDEMINLEMNTGSSMPGLNIQPIKSDIIIQDSFLLAIINLDILSEVNIPSIYLTVVEKEQFTKQI